MNANNPNHPFNKKPKADPKPPSADPQLDNIGQQMAPIRTTATAEEIQQANADFLASIEATKPQLNLLGQDLNNDVKAQSAMGQQPQQAAKLTQLLTWCKQIEEIGKEMDELIHMFEVAKDTGKNRNWHNLATFYMSDNELERAFFEKCYEWAKQEVVRLSQAKEEAKLKEKQELEKELTDDSPMEHFQLQLILKILQSRTKAGFPSPLWLYGAPGAGKTHIGQQIADHLRLKHYPIAMGPTTTETKIVGYRNLINGEYVEGCIYQPYKYGGVWQPDEIDATDPGVLVSTNAAIANDRFMFPNGEMVMRHKDFIILATANTIGTGSMHGYQRNRLDAATLDRFVKFRLQYDNKLERRLSGNPQWCAYVLKVRQFCEQHVKETIYVTPRASINGAALIRSGLDPTLVVELCIFNGMSESIAANIKKEVGLP